MGISVEVRLACRSAWVIGMEICGSLAWNGGGCFGFHGFELCEIRGFGFHGFGYDGWVFVGCGMGGFDVVDDGCDCCGCDDWWQWQWQWVWV